MSKVFAENGEYVWEFNEGVVPALHDQDYHQIRAISKSGMDLLVKSPAHYRASWERQVKEETPAMVFGRLTHLAILEPDRFAAEVIPAIEVSGKGKKAALEEFEEANKGKTIVSLKDYTTIKEIQNGVLTHPTASRLFTGGIPEASVFWTDERTGVECKGRLDYLLPHGVIVDLKTTSDASPKEFARSAANFRYHVQAAFYQDGLERTTSHLSRDFVFVAVEKTPPFAIGLYHASDAFLARGRLQYEMDIDLYAKCIKEGVWPCYSESILELNLPAWA